MEKEILKIVKGNSKRLDRIDARLDKMDTKLDKHDTKLNDHEELFTAMQQSILENRRGISKNSIAIKELRNDMVTGFDQIIGKLDFLIQENLMTHNALNRHEERIVTLESLHGIK